MKLCTALKISLSIIGFILYSQITYAQSFEKKNALYLEMGGNAYIYSVNYERILYQKNSMKLGARFGISVLPEKNFNHVDPIPVLPLEMLAIFGNSNHHVETGIGFTPFLTHEYYDYVGSRDNSNSRLRLGAATSLRIGYRYQKPKGGFIARIGFMPILNLDGFLIPWGGISIGKSF